MRRALWLSGALVLAFWLSLLAGGRRVLFSEDIFLYFVPFLHAMKNSFWQGQWPLWTSLSSSGQSMWASLTGPLYPLTWLYAVVPVPYAYVIVTAVHTWVGLVGTALLLRHYRLGWVPALIGGTVYGFSGFLVSHSVHGNFVGTAAYLPLILLLTHRTILEPGTRRVCWLALAIGLAALQDQPQQLIIVLMVAAGYGLSVAVSHAVRLRERRRAWEGAGCAVLGVGLGFAVGAAQLIPSLEAVEVARLAAPSSAGLAFMDQNRLTVFHLATLVSPGLLGVPADETYWGNGVFEETFAYAGVLPLLFAVTYLVWGPRNRAATWWAAAGVMSLAISLGSKTPLLRLVAYVPVLDRLRCPGRVLCVLDLAIAVLCAHYIHAMGARDDRQDSERNERLARRSRIGALVIGAFALFLATGAYTQRNRFVAAATKQGMNTAASYGLRLDADTAASVSMVASRTLRRMLSSALLTGVVLVVGSALHQARGKCTWPLLQEATWSVVGCWALILVDLATVGRWECPTWP